MSCCWWAAPTAATRRCCCTTPGDSARPGSRRPVVLAGNAEARDEALHELESRGRKVVATDNVLPAIGVLEPRPARAAIRDVFIRHVIGGKGLSRGKDFAAMVRAATPDVVLAGVEVLADGAPDDGLPGAGDVLVVDIGGATTDVYSVITPEGEDAGLRKEVVETMWRARTVEGDLGMRWNAANVIEAAALEHLLTAADDDAGLSAYAAAVAADPSYLPEPGSAQDRLDLRIAQLAATIALRRHGRPAGPSADPRPLKDVGLVVGLGRGAAASRRGRPAGGPGRRRQRPRRRMAGAERCSRGGRPSLCPVCRRAAGHERRRRAEARGGSVGCGRDCRLTGRIGA